MIFCILIVFHYKIRNSRLNKLKKQITVKIKRQYSIRDFKSIKNKLKLHDTETQVGKVKQE